MTGTTPFEGAEQRRHARVPLATRVEILYSTKQNLVDAICRDISIGGMFVESPAPPAVGSRIEFEVLDPQFRKLVYRVVDRHIQRGGTPYGLDGADRDGSP